MSKKLSHWSRAMSVSTATFQTCADRLENQGEFCVLMIQLPQGRAHHRAAKQFTTTNPIK